MASSNAMRRLERLAWKYRLLAALKARREEAEGSGASTFRPEEGASRKALFRRVAREFPGALREHDSLPAARLAARAERIEELIRSGGAAAPWIVLVLDFHESLRELLVVRRWWARRSAVEPADRMAAYLARTERLRRIAGPRSVRLAKDPRTILERSLHPPDGSLLEMVWGELEQRHSRPRQELEAVIFGDAPDRDREA